ncbi:non-specific lipid-transfer protein-like [Dendrobium catenatum]|uniref:non-specific lipid-transfer protein-like n=1 Tax=Dendrobium catenatum TaxID=906689 RepID=UPI0009F5FDF4|nr:non-specific lipid-transfer protein-like [Dendrobium catenatum]
MEAKVKCFVSLALLFFSCAGFERVNGAGECGSISADIMAFQMAPCASASQDVNAAVSASCCSAIQKIDQNPKCLCAVMLSNTAKSAGVNPGVAVTIPKRCKIANRPVGYKCGGYSLP